MSDSKKILVVDDSILARNLICSHFDKEQDGFDLVEAVSGDDALEKHKDCTYDHYILDYNMPGMNGIELAEQIKKLNAAAHIALCTANIQSAVKTRADELGLHFLHKPVSIDELKVFLEAA